MSMNKTSLPIHTTSQRPRITLPVWIGFGFLCVLLAFGAFVVRENYKSAIDNGEAQALSAAHVVSTHAECMMEASVQALRRIDTALGDDGISSAPGEISNISNAVGDLPAGFTYSVFD
jgi:two-component system, sensor histidine kinase PdtaS